MKKLLILILLLPFLAQAQVNTVLQKTAATGTVRSYSVGPAGTDTLAAVRLTGVINGMTLIYNSTTKKFHATAVAVSDTTVYRTVANSRSLAQTQTALNLKANLASPTFTGVVNASSLLNLRDVGVNFIYANNSAVDDIGASTGNRFRTVYATNADLTGTVTAPTFIGALSGNASTVTTNANLTGVVTSVGNATSIADAALSIAKTSGLQAALDLKANDNAVVHIAGVETITGAKTFSADVQIPAIPTNATSAASKSYIDNLITGITWKAAVKAGTTANITLSGTQTIDGYSALVGDRILVKNQTTQANNGIYLVASGAWTRTTDADTGAELETATVAVTEGTINGDTQWTCTATNITLGTTAITFGQISGAGTYSASTGLTLTGNVFAIDGTVATLAGSQTLTNKTLTTPVINGTITGTTVIQIANGGTGQTTAPLARTALGGSTIGQSVFTQTNPSAVTFPRYNADNTVSALDAATFRTAIGAGTGAGTVTSVTGTANQITSTGGTTPVISLPATITGLTSVTSTGFTGTINTAAQPNITSVGTLTSLNVSGAANLATTSGNVGIGTTTPSLSLDVKRTNSSGLSGTGYRAAVFTSTTAVNADLPGIILGYDSAGGGIIAPATESGNTNFLGFWTFNSAWGERVRITKEGNVGIGTTAPAYKLDVAGTGNFTGALSGTSLTMSGTSTLAGVVVQGQLNVGNSIMAKIIPLSGNTTLTSSYHTMTVDATSANLTITLPAAASAGIYSSTYNTGIIYVVKKINSSANTVTIDGNASETIDGSLTKVLSTQYSGYTIQSDGTNWVIIGAF